VADVATARRPARALMPWLLAAPVAAAHLLLAMWWPADRFGLGDATQGPARIEVAFVRDLQPAAPAAAPPPPAPRTRVLRAPPALRAASSPGAAQDATEAAEARAPLALDEVLREAVAPLVAEALPPVEPAPPIAQVLARDSVAGVPGAVGVDSAASAAAAVAAAASAAAATATAFEWPPSTRMSYLLTGNFNGPVEGQARVEWRLAGSRYQVELEVSVGPPFAPFVTRQLLSDGLVTAAGLEPRRYDEETRIAFRAPRRLSIALDADRVQLPNGGAVPRPAGVQDSASQFVQMTWLFTMQPARLLAGSTLALPLALPRHVETWIYEVQGTTTLETPVGLIDAVHVRPRQPPRGAGRGGGDLVAEFWVAPTLQNLPVRFLIRQDQDTWVDLRLARLPQQAERENAGRAGVTRR